MIKVSLAGLNFDLNSSEPGEVNLPKDTVILLLDTNVLLTISEGGLPKLRWIAEHGTGAGPRGGSGPKTETEPEPGSGSGSGLGSGSGSETTAKSPPLPLLCICDFIAKEAKSQRASEGNSAQRRALFSFLRSAKKCALLETPFSDVLAEGRKSFLDLLPRAARRLLLERYQGLSGTDLCLVITALALRRAGVNAEVLTFDAELKEALKELS